jgi:dolichyl-phosphate beta-glucosyltransferase
VTGGWIRSPPRPTRRATLNIRPIEGLTLVVPLYNESHRFRDHAGALADFVAGYAGGRLVFVDDGSSDGTPDIVERFIAERRGPCIELVRCPHRGKGAAIERGLSSARWGIAAFCDVDLATPLPELATIIDAAARAPVLAIGSRGTAASRLTRRQHRGREILGRAYNRAIQLSVVPGVSDTQCGAKALRSELWHSILRHCNEEGFAWDVEVIAVARALGITVQEIGIEWRHQDGSRVRPLVDGTRMLRAIPGIRSNVNALRRCAPAKEGGVFDDANAARLESTDATHWWFRSKATFVSLLIRRFSSRTGVLVDVGAGSGGVTAMLGWPPGSTLALDGNVHLVATTLQRHAMLTAVCEGAAVPARDGTASVVCALDVIEHVADPGPMIREIARVVAPDGCVIVNVPAHMWLWSEADEVLGHARRYNRRTLRRDLERNGLEVVWISHVFSWLTLPVLLRRKAHGSTESKLGLDVSSPLIGWASMILTRIESTLTRWIPLPVGTSVLCVARRAPHTAGATRAPEAPTS